MTNRFVVTHVVSGDLWAGAECQVYNLMVGLQQAPVITTTAVLFNEGVLAEKLRSIGIAVTVVDEKALSPLQMVQQIRRHYQAHGTRIVHTHGFKENVLGVIARLLARVPFSVRTVHGNQETDLSLRTPVKWLVNHLDSAINRYCQRAVVAVSEQLQASLQEQYRGKVVKISNFVDVDAIQRTPEPAPEAGHGSELTLGFVGRLVPLKRADLFIELVKQLNDQGIPCKGHIIGDGPCLEDLRKLADRLGASPLIEFKGFVNPVLPELKKLDRLVMPSDHEGLPMTVLEALALGIPVIAHNTGGLPELLDNNHCGWLVEQHTVDGYVEAVKDSVASPQLLQKKAEAALHHVQATFGLTANATKYIELYQGLSCTR